MKGPDPWQFVHGQGQNIQGSLQFLKWYETFGWRNVKLKSWNLLRFLETVASRQECGRNAMFKHSNPFLDHILNSFAVPLFQTTWLEEYQPWSHPRGCLLYPLTRNLPDWAGAVPGLSHGLWLQCEPQGYPGSNWVLEQLALISIFLLLKPPIPLPSLLSQ